MRVVSLLASATELVCALGAGDMLVGRSHECDSPEWVKGLPAVSAPTFDVSGSSLSIDELVRAKLRAGEPLYFVDDARIAELAPDVLLTQTHCEVCAVTPGDVAHGGAPSLSRREVVALRAGTLAGILEGFAAVASVLGREAEGERLVSSLRARLEAVRAAVRDRARPSVACLEWIEPVFAMGNWGPELVDAAGGESVLGTAGAHSTTTPWADVRAADPEVLVVAPCGFAIDRTLREMHLLTAQPGWRDLRAVRAGRVFVADGNLYFNRSGPTAFETAELLAEILHPDRFPPAHEGAWWRRYAGS
jgi:iron complex transport system substrate-binding protein